MNTEPIILTAEHAKRRIEKDLNAACLVRVCAWCFPQATQKELITAGCHLTHTICDGCRQQFFNQKSLD